jgi:hypothetical protein
MGESQRLSRSNFFQVELHNEWSSANILRRQKQSAAFSAIRKKYLNNIETLHICFPIFLSKIFGRPIA